MRNRPYLNANPALRARVFAWVLLAWVSSGVHAGEIEQPERITPSILTAQQPTSPSLLAAHSHLRFALAGGTRLCDQPVPSPVTPTCDAASAAFAARVQQIGAPIIEAASRLRPAQAQFDLHIASGMARGTASSGVGTVALASELATVQPSDEWLAYVIAREVAHVSLQHHEDNSAASVVASTAISILFPAVGIIKTAVSLVGSQIAAGSRETSQRIEADGFALQLLEATGYTRRAVVMNLAVVSLAPLGETRWAKDLHASIAPLVDSPRTGTPVVTSATTPAPPTSASETNAAERARLLNEADAVVFRGRFATPLQ